MTLALFALILALVFLSGFFSSSETALFSLSETKVKAYRFSKDSKKQLIAKLLEKPQDLLVTIFVLNTVVNILIQNTVSGFIGEEGSWIGKIFIPFVILLFFGEIFPKQLGLEKNIFLSEHVAEPLNVLQKIFSPAFKMIVNFANSISRILFGFLKRGEEVSPEEIQHVLKRSQEMGVLHPDEAFLASGYLELQEDQVDDIMRTKDEILAYDINEPLTKLIYLFMDKECTRVPVYQNNLDQVFGIIHANDFFVSRDQILTPNDLLNHLKKPLYCPETTSAKVLLKQFDQKREVLALVIDEYGIITGLITKEDLMEVVVGAITDRRDEEVYYNKVNDSTIIAKGQMDVEDVEKVFGVVLESKEDVFSIGGWLTEEKGDIPSTGWTYEYKGLFFRVLSADPNRVTKVFIQKIGKKHGS